MSRTSRTLAASVAAVALTLGATSSVADTEEYAPLSTIELDVELVAGGFSDPLYVLSRPGDTRRYVVEQTGAIQSIDSSGGDRIEVLDISTLISSANEQGLLGAAFDPSDPERLFVSYTDTSGDSQVVEYDFPLADAEVNDSPVGTVIEVEQDATNHNGGMLAFGPDGYLYISMGDGGSDASNAQDPHTLLGSILRLDVSSLPATIPASNPFADGVDGAPEVWAYGLRNPWRFSFDDSDLYIGDVGQGSREEVNLVDSTTAAGSYFGWNELEGELCYPSGNPCDAEDYGAVAPITTYSIEDSSRCAVTGGYVYRGSDYPALDGVYVYADFCTGDVMALRAEDGEVVDSREYGSLAGGGVTSFGTDTDDRLYMVQRGGSIYEITATQVAFTDVPSDHPFHDEIDWMVDAGLTTGYPDGTFRPTSSVTRQAVAAFLYRHASEDWEGDPGQPSFSDVDGSHPFFDEIEWLADAGIAEGYTDGTFRASGVVSRQAVAAFLYRYSEATATGNAADPSFSDVDGSHPFFDEIEWLADAGIATGYDDGTFRPAKGVSRQAVAAFLYRLVE